MTAPATSMFSAIPDRPRAVGTRFGWSDVLRALEGDEARARALQHYRTAGFTPDDMARSRGAREAAVDALCRAEDWLEIAHPGRRRERDVLRDARRRLEVEVWP